MRKLLKLAGIWTVLFSFCVQTTGAASLGMAGAPMAARNMMPPPSQVALQAVPMKALPAAPAPAPKAAAPKVQVPAEWGYYVLASGEVAAESARDGAASFKSGLPKLLAIGGQIIRRAIDEGKALIAKYSFEDKAPAEPLTGVNLAAPVPNQQAVEEKIEPAAQDELPEKPQQSMLVVREGVPTVKTGMLLNPVRPVEVAEEAPAPAPVIEHPMEALQGEQAEQAARPVNDVRNVVKFPHLHATGAFALRMPGLDKRRLHTQITSQGIMPRVEGAWNEGKGIRFRIVYLNPVGFSQADGRGFQYNIAGKMMQNPAEVVPQQYWGTYAVYQHGQQVDYQIEVENTGKTPIKNMTVVAAQEVLNREGKAGQRLPTEAGRTNVPVVNPGQTVRLRNSFKITSDWAWHGSLEQTHVRVTAGSGANQDTLAEAYQAGIIDPPPDI